MDRYFLDTEFIDNGSTIDLISIGIVCSDGRELYLQSCEFNHRNASDWVRDNVLKQLPMCPWGEPSKHGISGLYRADRAYHKRQGGQCVDQQRGPVHNCPWRTRQQMTHEVKTFFNPSDGFEMWGWCAGYDFVAICQLFGTMMDAPLNWPHYIKDIQYVLDNQGISDNELPQQEEGLHNALADARYIKHLWERLHVQEAKNQ